MTQESKMVHEIGERHAYIECDCADPHHVFRMELDLWEKLDEPELSLNIQLNPNPGFFTRLWSAFRYVFGMKKGNNWHWDSILLDEKAVDRMQSMMVAWSLVRKARKVARVKKLLKKMKDKLDD